MRERLPPRRRRLGRPRADCLALVGLELAFLSVQIPGRGPGDHSASGIFGGSLRGALRSPQVRGIAGSQSVFLAPGFAMVLEDRGFFSGRSLFLQQHPTTLQFHYH